MDGWRIVRVGRQKGKLSQPQDWELFNQYKKPGTWPIWIVHLRRFKTKTKFNLEKSCLMLRAEIWGNLDPLLALGCTRRIKTTQEMLCLSSFAWYMEQCGCTRFSPIRQSGVPWPSFKPGSTGSQTGTGILFLAPWPWLLWFPTQSLWVQQRRMRWALEDSFLGSAIRKISLSVLALSLSVHPGA